jgi:hypothetical protein
MNDDFLKNMWGGVYRKELLGRIRDITRCILQFIITLHRNWYIKGQMETKISLV